MGLGDKYAYRGDVGSSDDSVQIGGNDSALRGFVVIVIITNTTTIIYCVKTMNSNCQRNIYVTISVI